MWGFGMMFNFTFCPELVCLFSYFMLGLYFMLVRMILMLKVLEYYMTRLALQSYPLYTWSRPIAVAIIKRVAVTIIFKHEGTAM